MKIHVYVACTGMVFAGLFWSCNLNPVVTTTTVPTSPVVVPVNPILPSQFGDSGSTTYPSNVEDAVALFTSLGSNSANFSVLTNVSSAFSDTVEAGMPLMNRALNSTIDQLVNDVMTQAYAFPSSKTFNTQLNLTNQAIGDYLTIDSINASGNGSAVSTDGQTFDGFDNLGTGSGQVNLSVAASSKNLPAQSDIKGVLANLNFAAIASFTTKPYHYESWYGDYSYDSRQLDQVVFDYDLSFSIGVSINHEGNGGKIIVTGKAKNADTIDIIGYATYYSSQLLAAAIFKNMEVTAQIVADDGTVVFSKTYTTIYGLYAELFNQAYGY